MLSIDHRGLQICTYRTILEVIRPVFLEDELKVVHMPAHEMHPQHLTILKKTGRSSM